MKKGYFSTIFKNTIIDTYYGLWYYFLYILVVYHFLSILVIIPFFEHFIIRRLLSMEQFLVVGSGYVIRFLLYMVILYLEFALYILISEKIYNQKKITIVTIAKSLFSRVRFALSFSNWRIMIVFLMIFPFLNLPLTSNIIHHLDISVTIREYIKSHHMLYVLSIVGLIILVLARNIFLILFSLGMNFIGFFIFQDINFNKSKVMVHRAGGEIVTENTAEAIEYAVSNQFDAIEIDIMETADVHFVLSHDLNISRLTGQDKRINELTLKELKSIPIKGLKKSTFISLEEALEIAKGEVLVNIELKTHGRESPDYLDRLCGIITDFDMVDECLISSFDYSALKYIETYCEAIKTILIGFYVPMPETLLTDGLAVDLAYLTEDKAMRIKESDKLFLVWTVKDDSYRIFEAIFFNSDYIITDYPEILMYIMQNLKYFSNFMSMLESDYSERMEREKLNATPIEAMYTPVEKEN
jgi:glycerophosphoryl diester phosphodiesterase